MAVPSYTNDLTDWILDTDTAAWGELLNAAAGGVPDEADTESALQGTNSCSQSQNTTSLVSICRILVASVTLATNDVFLVWHGHGVATSMLSYASGGLRLAVATDLNNWKAWAVGGNDVSPFPYAKWVNNPVDPSIAGEYTTGTPPAALTFYGVGSMAQLSAAVGKGQPHIVDIIRYGRAQARFTGGETANFGTFAGFATANDAQTARWGLIQTTSGGYLWKGLMLLGLSTITTTNRARTTNVATLTTSGAHGFRVGDTLIMTGIGGVGYNATATVASIPTTTTFTYSNTGSDEGTTADTGGSINGVVDFRDSNKTVFIQDTRKVYSAFNKIEIRNASSRVDWTGIAFTCLSPSTTASKGALDVVDAADVNIEACTFTDMDTLIFKSTATINNSTFRRTAQITTSGATFSGCTIDSNTASSAMLAATPANAALISSTAFTSDGTGHAIEIGGTAASITLTGLTFTGYAATNGSTGNEAIYVNIGSGSMTISIAGGGSTPSIRTAGATVTVQNAVTVKVTVKDAGTLTAIENARVLLEADSVATGTHTGANNAATLTDSTKSFTTNALVNYRIYNTTDGSDGLITANDATTVTATLSGGTDNDWDTSDAYIIVARPARNPVSITSVTTTATVTHRNHGLVAGANVVIRGANEKEYNGIYTISNVTTNTYDYTMLADPAGSSATGTITATSVILNGDTGDGTPDPVGILQTTAFNYTINQPVTGKSRRATVALGTKYKGGILTGTITSSGLDTTVLLIPDE